MLNVIKIYIYVIEFQKRKLFYVHILIIIISKNDINLNNVNNVVKTIIFNLNKNKKLYDLIIKNIIHKNYLKNINVVCYNEKNNCNKYFSKLLNSIINLNYCLNYLLYKRYNMFLIKNTL